MSHALAAAANKKKWRGDDFPAWLSPMVVKELRQGVQSGAFAWTFIGLQGAMFLLVSWGLTFFEPGRRGPGQDFFHWFFWMIIAAGVLLVVPLRGLAAISSERIGNNLDLVRLTRLSATRIVVGKWLAILAQGALLVAAILPYLVLRYFFGGVNVIRDLELVGWLFAGSMAVTAAALALSTQPLWVRIGTGLLSVPVAFVLLETFSSRGGLGMVGTAERVGMLAILLLYTVVLLEYTASRIAPLAENHAVRKRTLALLLGGVWLAMAAWAQGRTAVSAMGVTLPLLLVYAIEAILERPTHLKSQAAAFVRFGLPGRLAARLLTPGWATGLVFLAVLAGICLPASWIFAVRFAAAKELMGAAAFGPLIAAAVLFPLPAVVYFSRVRYRLLLYALVQLVCFMAFVYTNAMKPHGMAWRNWPTGWLSMLPMPVAAVASLIESQGDPDIALASLVASGVVIAVVCLAVLPPWLREIRETGRLLAVARGRQERPDTAQEVGASA